MGAHAGVLPLELHHALEEGREVVLQAGPGQMGSRAWLCLAPAGGGASSSVSVHPPLWTHSTAAPQLRPEQDWPPAACKPQRRRQAHAQHSPLPNQNHPARRTHRRTLRSAKQAHAETCSLNFSFSMSRMLITWAGEAVAASKCGQRYDSRYWLISSSCTLQAAGSGAGRQETGRQARVCGVTD